MPFQKHCVSILAAKIGHVWRSWSSHISCNNQRLGTLTLVLKSIRLYPDFVCWIGLCKINSKCYIYNFALANSWYTITFKCTTNRLKPIVLQTQPIDAICIVWYNKITRSVWKGKCFEFLQVNDLIIWFWKKYFSSIGWSLNLHLIIGKWSLIMPCNVRIQVFYTLLIKLLKRNVSFL